jgi:hypothetical protein
MPCARRFDTRVVALLDAVHGTLSSPVRADSGAAAVPCPMSSENTSASPRPRRFGIAMALMCALAGGAVWCLLSLYSRSDLAAFAFVVAAFVVWQLRSNGYAGRWSGALVAAICVALAAAYSFYLQAVAQVASLLGLPMRTALMQIEPAMAIDIARANLQGASGVLVALAVVATAAAMMLRVRRAVRDGS